MTYFEDVTNTGKGEVEAITTGAFGGCFSPEGFTGFDGLFGMVIESDGPVGVGKHEQVVVSKVHEVQEFVAARFDAKSCVARGVARGWFDGDKPVKEFCLSLVWFEEAF